MLQAITEFNRMGREQFLQKCGFAPSRCYWLVHASPGSDPLRAQISSGGEATVKAKLEALGSEVAAEETPSAKPAFLMTWKKGHWPYEEILKMVSHLATHKKVIESWRISAHKQSYRGGRVWLLKQGSGEKGIFGIGMIVGDPVQGPKEAGKNRTHVNVRFTQLVDPLTTLLLREKDIRKIIPATKLVPGIRAE